MIRLKLSGAAVRSGSSGARLRSASMNSASRHLFQQGFSLKELTAVIGAAAILAGLLVFVLTHGNKQKPHISSSQAEAQEITCVNNLKMCGLAFRMWAGDNGDQFPMAISTRMGGTMEFKTGVDAFRHFQVMSNELSTPKILICPSDTRQAAADFTQFNNQNFSYFVALNASDKFPQRFLSGDRNITGPAKPENGILKLRPGQTAAWTETMHVNQGIVGLADGSVRAAFQRRADRGVEEFWQSRNQHLADCAAGMILASKFACTFILKSGDFSARIRIRFATVGVQA